ncbi:Importin subunit beta-1 [Porphyridium purpureum]|uniref:Importin subunit beta-1 n=1 Tax=Porphyridium purpureum TaxID=35688 RepID=A0A5J4YQM7_PORPP|nr:Importin subunit beta-1 [Porphyridium purpureum]|eukprot:POR2719..scf236_6
MDVTSVLLAAQSADGATRSAAEQQLASAEAQSFDAFVRMLTEELCDEAKPLDARRLASLVLKNAIDAKERAKKQMYIDRWCAPSMAPTRDACKAKLMQATGSPQKEVRHGVAQVIAKIAAIELSRGMWNDLIQQLLQSVTSDSAPPGARQAALDILGYVCEESSMGNIPAQVLVAQSNSILTAVVQGMRFVAATGDAGAPSQDDIDQVRLAATNALLNALDFARENFDREVERDFIMQIVCESITASNRAIQQTALECLVKVAENYYMYLPKYIQVLHGLVSDAMGASGDAEGCALQAIEFWASIAEEERDLMEEAQAAQEMGEPADPTRQCHGFVRQALPVLCPRLLECLMTQEEEQDDDTWNKSTAAGACMCVLAEAAPDQIVENVLPFIQSKLVDRNDWRAREAATMAFGSVLDGPPDHQLQPLIEQALPLLMHALLTDASMAVRDTTAWTLGRVCMCPAAIDPDSVQAPGTSTLLTKHLVSLVECLVRSLSSDPPVARNAAFALHNIAEAYAYAANEPRSELSPYYEVILSSLVQCSLREDGDEANLRSSAYEALNVTMKYAPMDAMHWVQQLTPVMLERLEQSIQAAAVQSSMDDRAALSEIQGLLCGVLMTATHRLKAGHIHQYADRLMRAYIGVLELGNTLRAAGAGPTDVAARTGTSESEEKTMVTGSMHEEALMAVGALADELGSEFTKYVPHLMPYVLAGLRNWEQYQVCAIAVAVVGDLCRAVDAVLITYGDEIVALLLTALQSGDLDKSVKPPILSCFGDLALALGSIFERYINHVMAMLQQAAQSSLQLEVAPDDFDMLDWLCLLRESILEAYTGVMQGLNNPVLLSPHVSWVISFCELICKPDTLIPPSDRLLGSIVGVLGDLAVSQEGVKAQLHTLPWILPLLKSAMECDSASVQEVGQWAHTVIFR